MTMEYAARFEKVDILFAAGRGGNAQIAAALRALDAGRNRSEIIEETSVVVGAADVNLDIAQGEIFVIMGLSGSGKTTVLRAVNGLNTIARGRILIRHGEETVDMSRPPPAVLRRLRNRAVSMVFQQFALLPWRTVRRNVELGLELRRAPRAETKAAVDRWLDLVGLLPWAEKHANELSGGMQQRVGLARALVTDPDILLMDEPFSALDPLIRNKLQDELLSLQRTMRKTIIFVTHDLDEALKIGNRIAIMKDGKVIQVGKPEDIVLRPATDYVAEFVRHMNPLTAIRAASLMRPLEGLQVTDGAYHFVDHEDYALQVDDSGRLTSLYRDGAAAPFHQPQPGVRCPSGSTGIVTTQHLLKDIVEIRQQTTRPILVADDNRIIGCIGTSEILDALTHAGRAGFSEPAASAALETN